MKEKGYAMIWKIVKKEFLLNILTFKYITGTFMCMFLVITFLPVLISDYQKTLEAYNNNVAKNKAELRKVKCYWSLTPTIHRAPTLLSIFSRGLEQTIPDSTRIELSSKPAIQPSSKTENHYLSIFPNLDVSLIMKIIISLLALLMSYDVISAEREHETLKLILSNKVSRAQVFIGKYLAGMITLIFSLLIAFSVAMLVLIFSPMIDIELSDWCRIGLMFFAYLLLVSAMYNVGLLFSCMIRKSSVCLVFSFICWVIFLFVIPNISQYLASYILPLEPKEKIDVNVAALEEKRDNELMSLNDVVKKGNLWGGPDSFGGFCYDLCSPGPMKYLNECFIHNEPLKLKYAQNIWEIKDSYVKALNKQRDLKKNISRLSPVCIFETITNTLANTDYESFRRYFEGLGDYRDGVIDYIKNKTDNFHNIKYFTPGQTEQERKEYYETMEGRKKHFENITPLALDDFPGFVYQPRTINESIKIISYDLTIMFIVNILLFAVAYVVFLRCDVR